MSRPISKRAQAISPFHVMDILAQAKAMQARGHDIIHMEVGEPDFETPKPIIEAGIKALEDARTHYTPALGLPELRQAIADWYQTHYSVKVSADRIIVTPGASGALLLVMGALLDKDHKVMLADPGYPCNRHFARFVEGEVNAVPVTAKSHYQLTAQHVEEHWDANTRLALVASPSNPTGTVLTKSELAALSAAVKKEQGTLIVDEIYHGLTYDGFHAPSALQVDDEAFVINSFSKFFGMTGWRLGWLVVPDGYTEVMGRLAQNLYLAAPTMSQYAALSAFEGETLAILEQRRQILQQRRDALLPALREIGFDIPVKPQGAFYLYANCSTLLNEKVPDSMALSRYLLKEAGVAITPGLDFGNFEAEKHCRFAYTTSEERLLEAAERIGKALGRL
ncbi:pyridoxal phosphate-dependent aminotransferase [Methylophaga sp. OBS1]|uniref:pyridoxal phosphate-dependent aminotransferase n=1 Tax=Methylophaga sp. OBS1 TaxID=2991933 RepID=UPI002250A6F1|nr:pyridoxal phosphate-dependent aminotransferase [Methylophaga sp. OBS1]MCX4191127.1 pyridoxal phosphate-dependent aminotransferase [Methylophaga sp. OBS1]MCX4191927.1 pyridoxal phosphate-dependent aminotransferase [Methylophaga sp. OBS1]